MDFYLIRLMKYIKIRLPLIEVDENGRARRAGVKRVESDMNGMETATYNLIIHALSVPGMNPVGPKEFPLDEGALDSPMWLTASSAPMAIDEHPMDDYNYVMG